MPGETRNRAITPNMSNQGTVGGKDHLRSPSDNTLNAMQKAADLSCKGVYSTKSRYPGSCSETMNM